MGKLEKHIIEGYGEFFLSSTLDRIADALVVIDFGMRLEYANKTATELWGYKKEEIVGEESYKFLAEESHAVARNAINELLCREDAIRNINITGVKKSGERFPINCNVSLLADEKGNPKKAIVLLHDDTERKKTEWEIKKMLEWQQRVNSLQHLLLMPGELDEKLKTVTDSVVDIFDVDFCRIWLIGTGDICDNCIHAKVKEGPHVCRFRDKCLRLVTSSGRYTHVDGEVHRRVPFGCYKIGRVASGVDNKFLTNDAQHDRRVHNNEWAKELGLVSFAGYQLKVPGGDTLGVLALFAKHPILPTEDAVLEGLSNSLAFVIQRAITNEELRQSNVNLAKANSELEKTVNELNNVNADLKDFVYIASHDLREPLRKVSSFGMLLKESVADKLEDDDLENFNFMIDGADRMTQMVDGLLVYSRVSTKVQPSEVIDVNGCVEKLKKYELAALLEESGAVVEVCEDIGAVEADPIQLRQLFQNLIANGIKYQEPGNIAHIKISSGETEDGMIRIEVADNGIGIAPEYRQNIFVMFKRLHVRDKYDGAGIGLSVCKKIVDRHGGSIGVESGENGGSVFWFTLPAVKVEAALSAG